MPESSIEEKLRKLDEALAEGRISEATYRELKQKYLKQLQAAPPPPPSPPSAPRRPWLPVALAVVLIAIVAIGGLLYLRRGGKPAPTPAPTHTVTPTKPKPPRPSPRPPRPPKSSPPPTRSPRPRRTPKPPTPTAQSPIATPRSPTPTAEATPSIGFEQLFGLANVKSFSYKLIITTAQGERMEITQRYKVESKVVDGRDCWAITIVSEMYGRETTLIMYVSKATLECVKMYVKAGQVEMEMPCYQFSNSTIFAAAEKRPGAELVFIGHETVKVPAGTFTCEVYECRSEGVTSRYWISRDVPIPIKVVVESPSGKTVMLLVSYQPA